MRKILSLFTCIFSFSNLYAIEHMDPNISILEEILVSKTMVLSNENVAKGLPIYAKDIRVTLSKSQAWQNVHGWSNCQHIGSYIGGEVETTIYFFLNSNGSITERHPIGHQVVAYQSDSGQKNSESKIWRIETIRGKKYIVHYHEYFQVYSSNDEQYVVNR